MKTTLLVSLFALVLVGCGENHPPAMAPVVESGRLAMAVPIVVLDASIDDHRRHLSAAGVARIDFPVFPVFAATTKARLYLWVDSYLCQDATATTCAARVRIGKGLADSFAGVSLSTVGSAHETDSGELSIDFAAGDEVSIQVDGDESTLRASGMLYLYN